jgi:hypothetical protein
MGRCGGREAVGRLLQAFVLLLSRRAAAYIPSPSSGFPWIGGNRLTIQH